MRPVDSGRNRTPKAESSPPESGRLARAAAVLKWLVVGASIWYLASYLVVALARIGYPFELEWMEGAVADHVHRILNGQLLYVRPSLDFVPFVYAPLYFFASAGLAKVIGLSLLPLRLVSFVSSLACFAIVYAFVRRESGSWFLGLVSAGLFAATFRAGGAWLDIARADSLLLALLLAGLYLARFGKSSSALAAAGTLFALAFHTKQTALFIALPVAAGLVVMRGLRSLAFIAAFGLLGLGAVPVLNSLYHGWYNFYVFFLPAHKPLVGAAFWQFWVLDLLKVVPVALGLAVVWLVRSQARLGRGTMLFYLMALAGMVAAAWSGRVHDGGYNNAVLPAYVGLAILAGLGAWALVRPSSDPGRSGVTAAVYVACLAQFGLLWYNPAAQIPNQDDRQAGKELVSFVAGLPGEVFMPQHGYLPELAGKRPFAHQMAICDLINADPGEAANRLVQETAQAIGEQRFSTIILDGPFAPFQDALLTCYTMQSGVFRSDNVFWTRTGMRIRPQGVFVPRSETRTAPAAPGP
jgi:4-amino-4-deoxy-L-arabinose transferase-like glycosyltransferase